MCPTPTSTLFPYTTLFRSGRVDVVPPADINCVVPEARLVGDLIQFFVDIGRNRSAWRSQFSVEHFHVLGSKMAVEDRKSTRLNSSHLGISYAVFCLKKKNT